MVKRKFQTSKRQRAFDPTFFLGHGKTQDLLLMTMLSYLLAEQKKSETTDLEKLIPTATKQSNWKTGLIYEKKFSLSSPIKSHHIIFTINVKLECRKVLRVDQLWTWGLASRVAHEKPPCSLKTGKRQVYVVRIINKITTLRPLARSF